MNIPIIFLETTTTTQDVCRDLLRTKQTPFAVLAKEQTMGRGTKGRTWDSKAGNLYLSFSTQIPSNSQNTLLPIVLATSVARSLSLTLINGFCYKWPNDILINNKKMCGILIEKINNNHIIGTGLNIIHAPVLPDRETTSLKKENHLQNINFSEDLPLEDELKKISHKILLKFHSDILLLTKGITQPFLDEFNSKLWKQAGEEVSIATWNQKFVGIFEGIGTNGEINISNIDGEKGSKKSFFYGDIL